MNKPKHIFKLISRITLYHLNHSYCGLELVIEPRCGNWNTNLLMEVIGYNYSEEGWTDVLDLSWRTFSGCSLDVIFIISVGVYEEQQNQENMAWGQGIEKLGQSEWMGWKCRGALGNKNKAQKPEGNLCYTYWKLLLFLQMFSNRKACLWKYESEFQHQFGIAYNQQRERKDTLFRRKIT